MLLTSGDQSNSVPLGTLYPNCVLVLLSSCWGSGSLLPSGLVEFEDEDPSFFFLLPPKQPKFSPAKNRDIVFLVI